MDATLERRLARLKNRRTAYELAMICGEERILVAYSQGKTRRDIHAAVSSDKRMAKILAKTGADAIVWGQRVADGGTMGEWSIRFTGRTQRDALTEGELPYIGDTP